VIFIVDDRNLLQYCKAVAQACSFKLHMSTHSLESVLNGEKRVINSRQVEFVS
jgi:hypothetical protein